MLVSIGIGIAILFASIANNPVANEALYVRFVREDLTRPTSKRRDRSHCSVPDAVIIIT